MANEFVIKNGLFVLSGNVGIGTSSPDQQFQIVKKAAAVQANLTTYSTTAVHASSLRFQRSHNIVEDTLVETEDGDRLGLISVSGVSSGSAFGNAARIEFYQNGSAGASYVPCDLHFRTSDGTAASAERMIIDKDGNVGIGTTAPGDYNTNADNLVVYQSSDAAGITIVTDTTSRGNLYFADGTGVSAYRGIVQYDHDGDYMRFHTAAAEAMRIDSAGNVGIGTTIPLTNLQVNAASPTNYIQDGAIRIKGTETDGSAGSGGALNFAFHDGTTANRVNCYIIGAKENAVVGEEDSYLAFGTRADGGNPAEAMRISSAGNVGIGVTPEAWSSSYTALQIGGNSSIHAQTAKQANAGLYISQNAYDDGAWKYISTDEASDYRQYYGTHDFRVAASGTADAAITWVTAMTIDNSGQVGIGATNPGALVDIQSTLTGSAGSHADHPVLRLTADGDNTYNIGDVLGAVEFYSNDPSGNFPAIISSISAIITRGTAQAYPDSGLIFRTTDSDATLQDRMVVASDGSVGIGTTTPNRALEINRTSTDAYLEVSCITSGASGIIQTGYSSNTTLITSSAGAAHTLGNLDTTDGNYSTLKFTDAQGNITSAITGVNISHTNNQGDLVFQTKSSGGNLDERMRIDNAGNVGIGVTPEAWQSAVYTALQIGGNAALSANTTLGSSKQINVLQNAYNDGAWKYQSTDEASRYVQIDGTHLFKVAVSGTADAAVTWIEGMKVDNAGNVGIGNSSLEAWSSTITALQLGGNATVAGTTTAGAANSTFYAMQNAYHDGSWKYISTDEASMYEQTNGLHKFYVAASGTADAAITWTTAMTIDNDGYINVGSNIIGNHANQCDIHMNTSDASDTKRLRLGGGGDVSYTRGAYAEFYGNEHATGAGDLILYAGNVSTGEIKFRTGGANDRIVIDYAGNVGIGNNSLEAWNSDYTALQIGGNSSLMSNTTAAASSGLYILQNAYYDPSDWKYISTDEASFYRQQSGQHIFKVASSGTADAAITWNTAMIIDNDGKVGILDASPSYELDVNGDLNVTGVFRVNGTPIGVGTGYWLQNGSNVYYNSPVGIGTSSPDDYSSSGNNLVIYEAGDAGITIATGTSNTGGLFFADGTSGDAEYRGYISYNHNVDSFSIGAAAGNAMYIDSNRNVGIGNIALEAWDSSYTALQIGSEASLMASTSGGAFYESQNAYYDGSWKYITTDEASQIFQSGGEIFFRTAVSGTADAAITWINSKIDNAGNIGIGNTSLEAWDSSLTALQIGGNASMFATTTVGAGAQVNIGQNVYHDGNYKYLSTDEASLYRQYAGTHSFRVVASGTADATLTWTEALYIDNNANVGIGNSSLEAWLSTVSALQIGGNASIMADTASGSSKALRINQNCYNDGSWKYISTDEASNYYMADGQHYFRVAASGTADAAISWTTAMTIDSAGNVGLGNSSLESWNSSYSVLQIGGNTSLMAQTTAGASTCAFFMQNNYHDGTNWRYQSTDKASTYKQEDGEHWFYVAESGTADAVASFTAAMVIDNASNVGINVTPEAWHSSFTALQIGGNASLMADTSAGAAKQFSILQNAYYDSVNSRWEYISTDEASFYSQQNGDHNFYVAVSGTADAAITWATAMHIDNTANVGIGNSSLESWSSGYTALQVGGNASLIGHTSAGASNAVQLTQNAYTDGSWKYQNTDQASRYLQQNGAHVFDVVASGTADAAITWVNALSLGNNGLLTALPTYSNDMDGDTTRALYINSSGQIGYDSGAGGGAGWADKIEEGNTTVEVVDAGTGYIVFTVDASEAMRIDDAGNVGIGTTTPDVLLHVKKSDSGFSSWGNNETFTVESAGADNVIELLGGTDQWLMFSDGTSDMGHVRYNHTSNYLAFGVGSAGSEVMRIDSAGRVGIGNTSLESWASTLSALQVGGNASVVGTKTAGAGSTVYLLQNAYTDGSWKYQDTDEASLYQQNSGRHLFYTAASGTADATISFTQAMGIESNGNVGIGMIYPSNYHDDADNLVIYKSSGNAGMTIVTDTTSTGCIYFADGDTSNARLQGRIEYDHSDNSMHFLTSCTFEAMVFDSSGNVGIGLTPIGKFNTLRSGGENSHRHFAHTSTASHSEQNWFASRGVVDTEVIVNDDDVIHQLRGYAWDGAAYRLAAGIYFQIDGTPSSGNMPARITFSTNEGSGAATEHMRIDSSGNVGIGNSSLEAWDSAYSALQIGGNAAMMAQTSQGASTNFHIMQNAYYDGSWKYISTDEATRYNQSNGSHTFYSAASGTADAAITFTTAMKIEPGAKVNINTTGGSSHLTIQNSDDSDHEPMRIYNDNSNLTHEFALDSSGNGFFNVLTNAGASILYVQGSSGNVGIGNSGLESWHASQTALQIGGLGSIMASTSAGAGNYLVNSNNAYFDTEWKYQYTDQASQYRQQDGIHLFRVAASGTVDTAITWTDAMTIGSDGNVQFNAYGAGTLTTDSSGNITAVSDMHMKEYDGALEDGVDTVNKMNPIFFKFKEETGLDSDQRHLGFYAQQMHEILPEAAPCSVDEEGNEKWGIYDRAVIATLVKAVQEMAKENVALESRLTALEGGING